MRGSRFIAKILILGCVWILMAGIPVEARVFFVAQNHSKASDFNDGSEAKPLRTLSAACRKARAGDTVMVKSGTYREVLIPRHSGEKESPVTFQAVDSDVWIKGSDVVRNWKYKDGLWVKRPWKERYSYDAKVMDDIGRAPFHSSARIDQVFVNGLPLQWYPDKTSLVENSFYWAPDGTELVLKLAEGADPNRSLVEVPSRPFVVAAWSEPGAPLSLNAIRRSGQNRLTLGLRRIDWIVIRGFHFAHSALTINYGAVRIQGAHWLLENNTVEWMNTIGISVDDSSVLRGNTTRFNGQTGFGGTATGVLMDGNTSLWDNQRDFSTSWGGGGSKICRHEKLYHQKSSRRGRWWIRNMVRLEMRKDARGE